MSKAELQQSSIQKSISLAWRLGRAVSIAQAAGAVSSVPERLIREFGGAGSAGKMFEGKIVGVGQYLMKGHTYGRLVIQRLAQHERDNTDQGEDETFVKVEIPFVNENLVLEGVTASGEKKVRLYASLYEALLTRLGPGLCPRLDYDPGLYHGRGRWSSRVPLWSQGYSHGSKCPSSVGVKGGPKDWRSGCVWVLFRPVRVQASVL